MLPRSTTCSMSCVAPSAFVRPRAAAADSAPSLAALGFRPVHPAPATPGLAPLRACASSPSIEITGPTRVPSCSALQCAAHLLWPLLTSPAPSPRLSAPVALSGRTADPPGIAHPPSRLCLSGLRRSVPCKYRALTILAVSPCCAASPTSCSSGQRFAFGFLQIRSHPRHPCRSANGSTCRARVSVR